MLVKDAMTKDPFTIDPEAPLGTAIDVMRTKSVAGGGARRQCAPVRSRGLSLVGADHARGRGRVDRALGR